MYRLLPTLAALTSALLVPRPARADDVTAQVDALYSRPDGINDRDALVAVTARMFRLVDDDAPRFAFVVEHDAVTEVKISVDGEAEDVRQRRGSSGDAVPRSHARRRRGARRPRRLTSRRARPVLDRRV
jgi:hypothetical protein